MYESGGSPYQPYKPKPQPEPSAPPEGWKEKYLDPLKKKSPKLAEDAGSGYSDDYEKERVERRKRTPIQKRQDRDLAKLSYMLNREKGRSFSQFMEQVRRMRVLRTAHYTSASSKEDILRSGFKDSPSTGTYHPDDRKGIVYTTPSSRVGSDYGSSRVNLRVVNPKVTKTDSPRDFGKNIKNWMSTASDDDIANKKGKPTSSVDQAKAAFQKGDKIVRVPNAHGGFTPRPGQAQGSYVMMDKDVANKSIVKKAQPTIKAKGKGRRTQTRMSGSLSNTNSRTNSTSYTPGSGGRYGIAGVGLAD